MKPPTPEPKTTGKAATWICWFLLFTTAIAGSGFAYKMFQFTKEAAESKEASFAVVPVIVYILVALGFVSLFLWALTRGQFRDIEGPKLRLLEQEEQYDREGV